MRLLLFLLLVGSITAATAQDITPAGFSLWHPLSTSDEQDTLHFNLGIFYSQVGAIHGAGVSLIGSQINHFLTGFQGSYIFSRVEGSAEGAQVSGIVSSIRGELLGMQAAGIVSTVGGSIGGMQMTGIAGNAGADLTGMQASGIVSRIKGDLGGFQGAGILSYTGGAIRGAQLGFVAIAKESVSGMQYGFVNVTGEFTGLRYGFINIADKMRGLPVGFVNVADTMTGLQIGFVNVADHIEGVPVGLINIAENGKIKAIAYVSTPSLANVGAKFIINSFYSIVSVGGYELRNENEDYASFSWHYGYQVPLGRFYIGADIGNQILFDRTDPDFGEDSALKSYQFRVLAGVDITDYLGVFGGVGGAWEHSGTNFDDGTGEPVFVAGLTVF
ncbi:MAG: LA_2272 family surface repeat-containing protein [Chitinispirillaceae bacterium]